MGSRSNARSQRRCSERDVSTARIRTRTERASKWTCPTTSPTFAPRVATAATTSRATRHATGARCTSARRSRGSPRRWSGEGMWCCFEVRSPCHPRPTLPRRGVPAPSPGAAGVASVARPGHRCGCSGDRGRLLPDLGSGGGGSCGGGEVSRRCQLCSVRFPLGANPKRKVCSSCAPQRKRDNEKARLRRLKRARNDVDHVEAAARRPLELPE